MAQATDARQATLTDAVETEADLPNGWVVETDRNWKVKYGEIGREDAGQGRIRLESNHGAWTIRFTSGMQKVSPAQSWDTKAAAVEQAEQVMAEFSPAELAEWVHKTAENADVNARALNSYAAGNPLAES